MLNESSSYSSGTYEIATVLFIDIVEYSLHPVDQQARLLTLLQKTVQETGEFRRLRLSDDMISLPTGDGMALVFLRNPVAPVRSALEIARALQRRRELRVRMGVHMGPVRRHADIREEANVVGSGINIAQRVMDCGDAGHILVSRNVAEVLEQLGDWVDCLQDLGIHSVKHGTKVHLYNLCTGTLGNPALPQKLSSSAQSSDNAVRKSIIFRWKWPIVTGFAISIVAAGCCLFRISNLEILAKLYLPLVVALTVAGCVMAGRLLPFGFPVPPNRLSLTRVAGVGIALSLISLYTVYDYGTLFPQRLQMEVFYDDAGVVRTLREVCDPDDLQALGLAKNYGDLRKRYFEMLDAEAKTILHGSQFFSVQEGGVHSNGQTSFIVKKIDLWQRYYIQESKGELAHTLDVPNYPRRQFYTLFEKLPTSDDYLTPSLRQLFVERKVILKPQFKELLAETLASPGVAFNVGVVGLTRLSVFPWPRVSPTVYCARFEKEGLVPIAYAMYK